MRFRTLMISAMAALLAAASTLLISSLHSLVPGPGAATALVPAAHEQLPRSVGSDDDPERFSIHGDYMPLSAGSSLTYRMVNGERFTITFGPRRQIRWFNDTLMEVVPVHDSRCRCQVLYAEQEGQVRAVGALEGETLSRWGEYVVIFPGAGEGVAAPVVTPGGRFERALRVSTLEGTTWFVSGIGIVKTDGYELIEAQVAH